MSSEYTVTADMVEYPESLDDRPDRPAPETIQDRAAPMQRSIRCDWWEEAVEQLQAIKGLQAGWDSHGAPSPDTNKLEAGRGLLGCLCEYAGLPRPHVNPTRDGGVQFEWEAGDRYFELEVVAERAATYLYCDDAAGVEETGNVFEDESLEPVLGYIRRVGTLQ
ncbi:MAG: hypothetical protein V3R99_00405 [Thermoguttaceae bacterium]